MCRLVMKGDRETERAGESLYMPVSEWKATLAEGRD